MEINITVFVDYLIEIDEVLKKIEQIRNTYPDIKVLINIRVGGFQEQVVK